MIQDSQKKIFILTAILLGVIIILALLIAWQKDKLLNFEQTQEPTNKTEQINIDTTEEEKEPTQQQQIIKEIIPESDLDEFELPDAYIDEGFLNDQGASPAFNRAGKITSLLPAKNQFVFLNDSLNIAKEYTVTVDQDTNILLVITKETYDNEENYQLISNSNESLSGTYQDLEVGDLVDIRAQAMINNDGFVAQDIRVVRKIINYLQ